MSVLIDSQPSSLTINSKNENDNEPILFNSLDSFAVHYLNVKTNIILISCILQTYYEKKEIDVTYIDIISPISVDCLSLFYRNIVNIESHYYRYLHKKWLTVDDCYKKDGMTFDFRFCISQHMIDQNISSTHLFYNCESIDDILSMAEYYPIQFKRILISLKQMSSFCKWMLQQRYLTIHEDCVFASQSIIKYVDTLEFKSLETISNLLLKKELIEYFDKL